MSYLLYIRLPDMATDRVTFEQIDAIEQAGVIDRTLLPVVGGGRGWALNRKSGYDVTGEIGSKRALLHLYEGSEIIAHLGVCLHSRASASLWRTMTEQLDLPDADAPPPAWAALSPAAPDARLPDWTDWWAKNVGFTLMTREGW